MMKLPLSPDIQVEDLVREFPAAVAFLRLRGVICLQCGEPVWGSIGERILSKGLPVESLMQELNTHLQARPRS
jgi:hypothetical protein